MCPKVSCRYHARVKINDQIDSCVKTHERVECTEMFISVVESYAFKVPQLSLEHSFYPCEALWLIKNNMSLRGNLSFGVRTKSDNLLALRLTPYQEKVFLGIGEGRSRDPFGLYENLTILFRTQNNT